MWAMPKNKIGFWSAALIALVVGALAYPLMPSAAGQAVVAGRPGALSTDGVSMVFGGDVIVGRSFSGIKDQNALGLFRIFQDADASFVNLEQVMSSAPGSPDPDMGTRIRADHNLLKDLKWAGVDGVSLANNHSMNFGTDGLLGTIRELDALGIKHGGGGANAEEAAAAGIVEAKGLKIGLIGLYSGTIGGAGMEQAGRARPGMFMLRAGEVDMGGVKIVAPVAGDLAAMTRAIEATRAKADIVVVSVHMHWGSNTFKEEPADYHPMVARAAIDAGADLFVIHGPHVPRGVEAYKNGFIAYSLGNLFWDTSFWGPQQPAYALDDTFRSIVVRALVRDKKISRLEVIPITIAKSGEFQGVPRLADDAESKLILDRTKRLSAVNRTKVAFDNWYGFVDKTAN